MTSVTGNRQSTEPNFGGNTTTIATATTTTTITTATYTATTTVSTEIGFGTLAISCG